MSKDSSLEVSESKLLSTCACSKCDCNPKQLPEFELKDTKFLSSQLFQNAFSFEHYARIILKYKNDPLIPNLSVEKTAEPQTHRGGIQVISHSANEIPGGALFIGRRDDKQKGGKNYLWDRSNDRNDCKKLYIEGGFISLNSCRLKPVNLPEYGELRRDRYCFHSNDGSIEIVVVHITPRDAKRCRCYCHKDIPFETRKRKNTKKAEEIQPPSKKPLLESQPETTSDANENISAIADILTALKGAPTTQNASPTS